MTRTIARATKGARATAHPGADSLLEAMIHRLAVIVPIAATGRPAGSGRDGDRPFVVMVTVPFVVMVIVLFVVMVTVPSVRMVTVRSS